MVCHVATQLRLDVHHTHRSLADDALSSPSPPLSPASLLLYLTLEWRLEDDGRKGVWRLGQTDLFEWGGNRMLCARLEVRIKVSQTQAVTSGSLSVVPSSDSTWLLVRICVDQAWEQEPVICPAFANVMSLPAIATAKSKCPSSIWQRKGPGPKSILVIAIGLQLYRNESELIPIRRFVPPQFCTV